MFFGIIIRLYFGPIEGNLPTKQLKLVLAWAELHKEELLADWDLAMNGEIPFKIDPLR